MKKIFFILFLLLLTGCTAKYDLEYKEKTFCENFEVQADNSEGLNDYFNIFYNGNISTNFYDDEEELAILKPEELETHGYKSYNKAYLSGESTNGFNLDYCFKENIDKSSIINTFFDNINISEDYIFASDSKDVFDIYENLTLITISFSTDKYIKDSNADEIKNNIHYWYVNRDNYKNKTISISLSDNILDTLKIKDNETASKLIDISIIVIVLTILIAIIIIYNRYKKTK